MDNKLLIKNGTLVDAIYTYKADILIENGIIKTISDNILLIDNTKTIDASGMLVMPGAVDVHTHLNIDVSIARSADDFETGTIAAACGGTTTIVDHMGFGKQGCTLQSRVDEYQKYADGKAVIDYSFHGVLQHVDENILNEMEVLATGGITSFKFYMTYGFKFDDKDILIALKKAKELGVLLCVHAENHDIIEYLKSEYAKQGKLSTEYHALSRPDSCEVEAIERVIKIAEMADNAPIYIVHVSTGEGAKKIEAAQRNNQNVYAETCTQYLTLDDTNYKKEDGLKYVMSPPLRSRKNIDELWNAIAHNTIKTIATDHCSFNYSTKLEMGKNDFRKCPNGFPGIESRVNVLYTEGVFKSKISVNKFVELVSTNPAKLFGLYPKKGSLNIGSDGDIIILNPNKKSVITKDNNHENIDYAGYEGYELDGQIITTILRGNVIYKDNEFTGKTGGGLFIKRDKPILDK